MQYEGVITKMQTEHGKPIQYYLVFESSFLNMNQLLGSEIELEMTGYQCLNCSRRKKVFRQGFCYDCFTSSAHAGEWIIRPELSTAHLGIADRDLDHEAMVQLQPHIVYLAVSCEVKVGVTRKSQIPTRWIDQGAHLAIEIVEVPNRYLAGITEVVLKNHYTDKTNWKRMLLNEIIECDLHAERLKVVDLLPEEVRSLFSNSAFSPTEIHFPVLEYPKSITTINFEKSRIIRGRLVGIKGQYLLFENGTAFNVRAAEGALVRISV